MRRIILYGLTLAALPFLLLNSVTPYAAQMGTPAATQTVTQAATPIAAGSERIDNFQIRQVYVPAGCFQMGSDPKLDVDAQPNEQPQHRVCISHAFWLDQFDVTNAAFAAFVKAGGYTTDTFWSADGLAWKQANTITEPESDCISFSPTPLNPRVCVNYYEAEAYANWRACRLPTEAEWEYAARGSANPPPIYPWGNVWDENKANTITDGVNKTTKIDAYPQGKSWVGAYDMAGNVFNWVSDWYDASYYATSPQNDPTGPKSGQLRVGRGGSWRFPRTSARTAARDNGGPDQRFISAGIRLVCPVTVPSS